MPSLLPDMSARAGGARRIMALAIVSVLAGGLGGCDIFKPATGPKLEGERISVLALDKSLESDPRIGDLQVMLPRPYVNRDWPQPGGYADHAMHHLALPQQLAPAWQQKAGKGADADTEILAEPIIADGRVFVLDAQGGVSALAAADGRKLWRAEPRPTGETDFDFSVWPPHLPFFASGQVENPHAAFGGGVAFADGRLFLGSGYGFIAAFNAETGQELWRTEVEVPIRSAPTVNGGRVFAITHDNQLYVLAADDGRILWTHQGLVESAGVLGSAAPAVSGDTVVVPFTSGELVALRVENGRTVWTDTLTRAGRVTAISELNDIAGRPVIDRGRVFAISHSGNLVSIDLRTGERVWTRNIAGVQTPWVAGDFIYVLTLDAEVAAVSRRDGRVRWVRQLRRYKDQEDREGRLEWSGPVLAGDRLIAVSNLGHVIAISPYDGEVLGYIKIPAGTYVPPVVADRSLYLLTKGSELLVYR